MTLSPRLKNDISHIKADISNVGVGAIKVSKTALHAAADFEKRNTVLCIAFAAALITCFVVPIDDAYAGYLDYKTLSCLFCVLAVVCALKDVNFFYMLARKIVEVFKNTRAAILGLVYITFIGSMLIANDMALLTFLPLGFIVLSSTKKEKYMAFTFIMQNIAANLGGMLTPFGNPQNLYLYSHFDIPTGEFMGIMAPPFLLAISLITLCCIIFVGHEPMQLQEEHYEKDTTRTVLYLLLFTLSIAIVFRGIPYQVGLVIIPIALLFLDRHALKEVDYGLLFTFVFFFVFAGNMARIDVVKEFMSQLMAKDTLLYSVISCQFISNVPSSILLSQFTENYRDLLVGVNIGGCGTLIASLASLITFREYTKNYPGQTVKYILEFSAFNFGFLIIMTTFMKLFF